MIKNIIYPELITETSLDLSPGITCEDKLLWKKDKNAVEFCLNYAKLWCKFCKDLVVSLEKKTSLEIEFTHSLSKQMHNLNSTISSNTMIGAPLISETIMMTKLMIDQCKEIEEQNTKTLRKLLDVINRQQTEFNKTRQHYKEKWKSDCKKMSDVESFMYKTRASYYHRCTHGLKLREELTNSQTLLSYMLEHIIGDNAQQVLSVGNSNDVIAATQINKQKAKVDKLEKLLADNVKKENEMLNAYKESVDNANVCLIEFEKKKLEHICDIRLITWKYDEVVKDSLAEFFRILFESRTSMLNKYSALSKGFQEYIPCNEFKCLVEKHVDNRLNEYSEKFQLELFHDYVISKERSQSQSCSSVLSRESDHEYSNRGFSATRSITPSGAECYPEFETISTNEINGPSSLKGLGMLNTIVEFGSIFFRPGTSNNSSGVQVENRRNQSLWKNPKITHASFGSSTESNTNENDSNWKDEIRNVNQTILKCIEIIERNGIKTHGIYRLSASKTKLRSVIDSLDIENFDVQLELENPITLANIIKSKLIQLSEPLIPYNLYPFFVQLGKEAEQNEEVELIRKLGVLITQIPPTNRNLAGLLFHHLKRVANNNDENEMGSMNLGTLFAPTLLKSKSRFCKADIGEFMDNSSQVKVVQLLIENVEELFGSADQYYVLDPFDNNSNKPEYESIRSSSESFNKIAKISDSCNTKRLSVPTRPPPFRLFSSTDVEVAKTIDSQIISNKGSLDDLNETKDPTNKESNIIRTNSPKIRERKIAAKYEIQQFLHSDSLKSNGDVPIIPRRRLSSSTVHTSDPVHLSRSCQSTANDIVSNSSDNQIPSSAQVNTTFNTVVESPSPHFPFATKHAINSSSDETSPKQTDQSQPVQPLWSPFVRQSNIRTPFVVRSLSNSPVNTYIQPKTSSPMIIVRKVSSADNIQYPSDVNTE